MSIIQELYSRIDNILLDGFSILSKIIKSKESSDTDKIQAINSLMRLREMFATYNKE